MRPHKQKPKYAEGCIFFTFFLALFYIMIPDVTLAQLTDEQQNKNLNSSRFQRESDQLRRIPSSKRPAGVPVQRGGPASTSKISGTIKINDVVLSGNKAISSEDIKKKVKEVSSLVGKQVAMNDLNNAAMSIIRYYRDRGYFLAYAYIPAQRVSGGIIKIAILEGKLDSYQFKGDYAKRGYRPDQLSGFVEGVLCSSVSSIKGEAKSTVSISKTCKGQALPTKKVERALGLVSNLPGIQTAAVVLSPGKSVGSTILDINTVVEPRNYRLTAGIDNFGNENTGKHRFNLGWVYNNPFKMADQFSLNFSTSGSRYFSGATDYNIALGKSGLRWGAGFDFSKYKLGGDFAVLNAKGSSNKIQSYLTYPLILTSRHTLDLKGKIYSQKFEDKLQGNVLEKSANNYGLELDGFFYDSFLRGSATYYGVGFTAGKVSMNDLAKSKVDTSGTFNRINYRVSRDQVLGFIKSNRISLLLGLEGQKASKHLDSSQYFSLGGYSGVRAYPGSEGSADEGMLFRVELKNSFNLSNKWGAQVSLFRDQGTAKYKLEESDKRKLSGNGISLNLNRYNRFNAEIAYAKRDSSSDKYSSKDGNSVFWMTLNYIY